MKVADVVRPPAPLKGWHRQAHRWYVSLGRSGESLYFEPSDWEYARLIAGWLSDELKRPGGPTTTAMTAIMSGMDRLGTTEGARRRMRIEIEHPAAALRSAPSSSGEAPGDVAVLEQYRRLAET